MDAKTAIATTPFETLCSDFGLTFPAIAKAREEATLTKQKIAKLLKTAGLNLEDTLSFVAFGSLARGEWTTGSDVDWTLLVDGPVDPEHFKQATEIRALLASQGFPEPGPTGTFGTLGSSHDLVHQIGGLDDGNRNMTRRLLMVLESDAIVHEIIRERVLRAVLNRYVICGASAVIDDAGRLHVPRFLLNDVVRYWRTMAVDYAAKKWEQPTKGWALRNIKLRTTRKMIFAKGLLLCFDCELRPKTDPWKGVTMASTSTPDDAKELPFVTACKELAQLTPIDMLSRHFLQFELRDLARETFSAYDAYLAFIDEDANRTALREMSPDNAATDPIFTEARAIGRRFGQALEKVFFDGPKDLIALTRKYGLF